MVYRVVSYSVGFMPAAGAVLAGRCRELFVARSVDSDGGDLWIEVKATTGRHGQFDWPRGEFELALAERDRYVLYRVYEADTTHATYRDQRDPVGAILAGKMKLDVSGLAAEMAPLSRPNVSGARQVG